jgi:hypothetical protein
MSIETEDAPIVSFSDPVDDQFNSMAAMDVAREELAKCKRVAYPRRRRLFAESFLG